MSKYTTELRFICETEAGLINSEGYNSINEIVAKATPKIFSFTFPIFDESYRNILCAKILKHYYTREISEETYGLWKLRLETKLNEIMPYYNQMYKSELIDFNPLYDTDISTEHNRQLDDKRIETITDTSTTENKADTVATTTGTSEASKTERDLFSDTPQGALTNVENETYLTNARKKIEEETATTGDTSKANTTATVGYNNVTDKTNNLTSLEDYTTKVLGKNGGSSFSKYIQEFRETFLNIDMSVIDELAPLFFNLW